MTTRCGVLEFIRGMGSTAAFHGCCSLRRLKLVTPFSLCRQSFRNGNLSEEKIRQLEEIPTMMWELIKLLGLQEVGADRGVFGCYILQKDLRTAAS